MKEMTTTDIQQVSLEILKDVHSFCKKENIKYSLAYGTLIGAIRHRGFIPWDDDIDIMMPRPDYERFIKEYKSCNGYDILPDGNNSMIALARVYDTQRTQVNMDIYPWCKKNVGVWIDIFPIDGAEDDMKIFKQRVEKINKLWLDNFKYRSTQIPYKLKKGIIQKAKLFIKRILWKKYNTNFKHIQLIKSIAFGSTNNVTSLSIPECETREYFPLVYFNEYIEIEFEKNTFFVIKEYDKFLNNIYGDYMKLPPIDERKPKHSFNKYYWK